MTCIESIKIDGLLSFPPGSPAFELKPLNVLIGPNGAGKSNFIDAFGLLGEAPRDLAAAIRSGGGAEEWLWKGAEATGRARVEVVLGNESGLKPDPMPRERPKRRYALEFGAVRRRVQVLEEVLEEVEPAPGAAEAEFYYRFRNGRSVIDEFREGGKSVKRSLKPENLNPEQSALAQFKDPDLYPALRWTSFVLERTVTFRNWTFGPASPLRKPQPADLPDHRLLPENQNLAHVLHYIEHRGEKRLEERMKEFFPRFERLSTRVGGGAMELYLHEEGLTSPIPANRISDGTLRFMALLATLLYPPDSLSLVCIEEPELGLHPDAVMNLAPMFVETRKDMQLIVTTHSDALISALSDDAESLVVCERPGAGTELRRPDSDDLASWLDEYETLGDVWRMGALGGNP